MTIKYEIKTTELKPYTYKKPLIALDKDGQTFIEYSKHQPTYIKKLTLLNLVGRNSSGNIVSYEPIDYVNRFLMSYHIEEGLQESDQLTKGLVHYFSFLIDLQRIWDEEYDEDDFDELIALPRPTWNCFPIPKHQKVTYKYRSALRNAVLHDENSNLKIARTTATAYMRAVVKFYTFHIRNGYQFNNPPFEYEIVTVHYGSSATNMNPYSSKEVHTTDLRLNFGKSKRNEGGALPSSRRNLNPLSNAEWSAVENVLLFSKKVLKNVGGHTTSVSLSKEYCLFFLISRYTGLRKEEVASLHKGQIVKPDSTKQIMRLGVGSKYGSLTKTKGDGNKSRQTIIPCRIMQLLYEYTISDRYKQRQKKFKNLCAAKHEEGDIGFFEGVDGVDEEKEYLFLSQTGKPLYTKLSEINTRWNEIRATVRATEGISISGVVHNLRATFAVSLFRALLRKTTPDIALAMVSECLGHDDEASTHLYLNIAQDNPTGDEIYEDILEFIGLFDCTSSNDLGVCNNVTE